MLREKIAEGTEREEKREREEVRRQLELDRKLDEQTEIMALAPRGQDTERSTPKGAILEGSEG